MLAKELCNGFSDQTTFYALTKEYNDEFINALKRNNKEIANMRLERGLALVEGHLHDVVLEGDDVSHLTLGGELQAGGYVHIVKHRCECSGEAIGYLRPRGKRGQTKVAQG